MERWRKDWEEIGNSCSSSSQRDAGSARNDGKWGSLFGGGQTMILVSAWLRPHVGGVTPQNGRYLLWCLSPLKTRTHFVAFCCRQATRHRPFRQFCAREPKKPHSGWCSINLKRYIKHLNPFAWASVRLYLPKRVQASGFRHSPDSSGGTVSVWVPDPPLLFVSNNINNFPYFLCWCWCDWRCKVKHLLCIMGKWNAIILSLISVFTVWSREQRCFCSVTCDVNLSYLSCLRKRRLLSGHVWTEPGSASINFTMTNV